MGLFTTVFYLGETGFLQVICEKDGITPIDDGIVFYTLVKEVNPLTARTWDEWLPNPDPQLRQQQEKGWWIGNQAFPPIGLDADNFGAWLSWAYYRRWSANVSEVVDPVVMQEFVHLNPFVVGDGMEVLVHEHQMMLFGRFPPIYALRGEQPSQETPVESLILTAVRQKELPANFLGYVPSHEADGTYLNIPDRYEKGMGVEAWVGISLLPEHVIAM